MQQMVHHIQMFRMNHFPKYQNKLHQMPEEEFPLVYMEGLYRNVMVCTRIDHNNKSKTSDRNSVIQTFISKL